MHSYDSVLSSISFGGIANIITFLTTAIIILMLSAANKWHAKNDNESFELPPQTHLAIIALAGTIISIFISIVHIVNKPTGLIFNGYITEDSISLLFTFVISIGCFISIIFSGEYLKRYNQKIGAGEIYALMLLAATGAIMMVQSTDLIALFIGLETMSLAIYALTGFNIYSNRSKEASLKYFVYGAVASAVFIYGTALVYSTSSSPSYFDIQAYLLNTANPPAMLWIGLALILIGMAFKVAAVPFHMWAPDVYDGAPTAITSFMAVVVKAAAFGALMRFIIQALSPAAIYLPFIEVIAILTMIVGNLLALRQTNLKRMLAYSSIAHAGYLMVGVVAGLAQPAGSALPAILWYLLAYTFMTSGAFGIILLFEKAHPDQGDQDIVTLNTLNGLARKQPLLALLMAIFMFSLAGIPPTAGFFGKFYLFGSAVAAGKIPLVIFAVLNSVLAAYYYLRVTVALYLTDQESIKDPLQSTWINLGLIISAIIIILVGIMPDWYLHFAQRALGI